MLSTENHNPSSSSSPDPFPCAPTFHFPPSQLINPIKPTATATSCSPQSDRPEVDLPHSRSSFSIRDYVLTARSKDIRNNWPFSLTSLHLCLKHGVKDVLPPFQSLDDVRNQSLETFSVGKSSFEKHSIGISEEQMPSRPDSDYAALPDSSNDAPSNDRKLAEPCIFNSSSQSGLENDFLSTRTGMPQSEIESLIPDHGQSKSLPFKNGSLLKVSTEVDALGPHATNKNESTFQPLGKKCRLIVKFSGNSDHSSTEDIASNCTTATVSESMASKVCPVCKTFSSSSNTTLNAHIDQCLSKESTPEWMCGSKLTRHRIKPRKTRLMVDVYAMSQRCTLEDLDRRNGTSWATASSLPTHKSENNETPNDAKKKKLLPVHPQDTGDVGLVYIDANGTKVRILSNLNGLSTSALNEGNDMGAKRPLKGSKYTSKKKKKRLAHKHQKYLKLAPQSKKCVSHKVQGSQTVGGQKAYNGKQKTAEDDGQVLQRTKLADSGSFKPWLQSKRRGCTKKITRQVSLQPVRCQWHLPRDLLVENDRSLCGGSLVLENHAQKITDTSGSVLLSTGNFQRKERLHHKAQISDKGDQASERKRVESSLVATTNGKNAEGLFLQRKQDADQFGKNKALICSSNSLRTPDSTGNHKCYLSKKLAGIQEATKSSDVSPSASSKLSHTSHAIVTKAKRFSSFRRNILSAGSRSLMNESGQNEVKIWPVLQESSLHGMARKDKDPASQHSEGDREYIAIEDRYENQFKRGAGIAGASRVRATALENNMERRGLLHTSQRDNAFAFKRSIETGTDVNSLVKAGGGYLCKIDCSQSSRHQIQVCEEDLVIESSSRTFDGRNTTHLSKFVDSHFYMPSHSFRAQSNSFQAIEGQRGQPSGSEAQAVPAGPHIFNDQHMFSGDEVENGLIGSNSDLPAEFDSEAGCENVFPEVDPIPIPSPPGSYLPSPRNMGSDDFQGNSSLTTSQVQSSPDRPDVVDGDSSDSNIYVASTISNATEGVSDPKYCEPVPAVRPISFEDRTRSGPSGSAVASIDPSIQKSGALLRMTDAGAEGPCFIGEYSKLNNISAVKESFIFKNDQPCCCQRKERFSQGVGYHQESQLLRRRMIPPLSIPAAEKQVDCDASARHPKLDRRLELVPPSICTTSGSEKLASQIIKIPTGLHPLNNSPNVRARLLTRPDCGSASPSASNPILRLMGKNLMVVNKDEESSTPIEPVQPSVPHDHCISQNMHQTCQLPAFSIASPANNPTQNRHTFHHAVSQSVYVEDRHSAGQYFDVGLLGSSGSHPDPKSPEELVRLPTIMFRGQHKDYGFATPVETLDHKGDYSLSSLQNRLEHRLSLPFTMENAVASPDGQCKHADSSLHPVKEIIIIDDSAESETLVVNDGVTCAKGWREAQAASAGTPAATISNFNPSRVYPFSCYQSPNCPPRSESPAVNNATFHAMASTVADTPAIWWGCSTDGSDAMQWATLTSSSSAGHLRSPAMYYSPSYS